MKTKDIFIILKKYESVEKQRDELNTMINVLGKVNNGGLTIGDGVERIGINKTIKGIFVNALKKESKSLTRKLENMELE